MPLPTVMIDFSPAQRDADIDERWVRLDLPGGRVVRLDLTRLPDSCRAAGGDQQQEFYGVCGTPYVLQTLDSMANWRLNVWESCAVGELTWREALSRELASVVRQIEPGSLLWLHVAAAHLRVEWERSTQTRAMSLEETVAEARAAFAEAFGEEG